MAPHVRANVAPLPQVLIVEHGQVGIGGGWYVTAHEYMPDVVLNNALLFRALGQRCACGEQEQDRDEHGDSCVAANRMDTRASIPVATKQ